MPGTARPEAREYSFAPDGAFIIVMTYLRTRFERFWTAASEAFKRDTAHFSSRHIYFGLVAGAGFPLYYVVWHDLFPQPYETLTLRLVGTALFVPIIWSSCGRSR